MNFIGLTGKFWIMKRRVASVYIVALSCFRNKMTLTNVKMSFGKFYNIFVQYWDCRLNRQNRQSCEVFIETDIYLQRYIN